MFIHRNINHRIDATGQIKQQVAQNMQWSMLYPCVEDLHNGNRKIADDKANENHQHHFGDLHFASFKLAAVGTVLGKPFVRLSHHPKNVGIAQDNNH